MNPARFVLLALAVASISGCGRGAPVFCPVTGTVKIDGKPTGAVQVRFSPADASADNIATRIGLGITDAQGKFSLICAGGTDGIEAGDYKVTFSRPVEQGRPVMTSATMKPEGARTIESIPPIYLKPETTPVTATVPKGGKDFIFEVKAK